MRAYEVLVIPYLKQKKNLFATFLCRGDVYWQPITGGGEENEDILSAAMREAYEEAGIEQNPEKYMKLQACSMIPAPWVGCSVQKGVYLIPEYCFAVQMKTQDIRLSHEHSCVEWLPFEEAFARYRYEADKIALWELNERLNGF